MTELKVGDIVSRKSYGGDVYFTITDIVKRDGVKPMYILKGLMHRLQADCDGNDLVIHHPTDIRSKIRHEISGARRYAHRGMKRSAFSLFSMFRERPGKILQIDSSQEFLDMCRDNYRQANLESVGKVASESEQPQYVRRLLEKYKPDILVVTGHDSMKKGTSNPNSINSYQHSRYFIESVKEARKYQPNHDKLCVFAGACQSFFEGIMEAGANFASSPGRVLINALDPAIVAEKIALTDSRIIVTPEEVTRLTVSGRDGIGGVNTRGHLIRM